MLAWQAMSAPMKQHSGHNTNVVPSQDAGIGREATSAAMAAVLPCPTPLPHPPSAPATPPPRQHAAGTGSHRYGRRLPPTRRCAQCTSWSWTSTLRAGSMVEPLRLACAVAATSRSTAASKSRSALPTARMLLHASPCDARPSVRARVGTVGVLQPAVPHTTVVSAPRCSRAWRSHVVWPHGSPTRTSMSACMPGYLDCSTSVNAWCSSDRSMMASGPPVATCTPRSPCRRTMPTVPRPHSTRMPAPHTCAANATPAMRAMTRLSRSRGIHCSAYSTTGARAVSCRAAGSCACCGFAGAAGRVAGTRL